MTNQRAKVRLNVWAERLAYIERELKRLPAAREEALERVAYWQARCVEEDEDTVAESVVPEPMVTAEVTPKPQRLTREDTRYLAGYSPWVRK